MGGEGTGCGRGERRGGAARSRAGGRGGDRGTASSPMQMRMRRATAAWARGWLSGTERRRTAAVLLGDRWCRLTEMTTDASSSAAGASRRTWARLLVSRGACNRGGGLSDGERTRSGVAAGCAGRKRSGTGPESLLVGLRGQLVTASRSSGEGKLAAGWRVAGTAPAKSSGRGWQGASRIDVVARCSLGVEAEGCPSGLLAKGGNRCGSRAAVRAPMALFGCWVERELECVQGRRRRRIGDGFVNRGVTRVLGRKEQRSSSGPALAATEARRGALAFGRPDLAW
ncbi:uncharacterized protein LOC120295418 [Eucalyptus grandis]|uniref:uncharacterized protein LOC120295418 n=1 Tax=Eucalyptus grandis TaxID=71139 RepID=UPI00192F10BB|nr:uncharacterized protein LOC120295418 [Eucalyptus grandis]